MRTKPYIENPQIGGDPNSIFHDEASRRNGWLVLGSVWFLYSAQACVVPHLTRYFDLDLGLGDRQIGLLMALPALTALIAQTFWGAIADRYLGRTNAYRITLLLSAILIYVYIVSFPLGGFWFLLLSACLFMGSMNSCNPIINSLIFSYLGKEKRDLYGRVRIAGSFSFSVTITLLCPILVSLSNWLGWYERSAVFSAAGFFYIAALLCARWNESEFEKHQRPDLRSLFEPLRDRNLAAFFFSIFLVAAGLFAGIQYIGPFVGYNGGTEFYYSLVWLAAVSAEIIIMLNLQTIVRAIGLKRVILIGLTVDGIRWICFYFISNASLFLLINTLQGPAVVGIFFASAMYVDTHCKESIRSTAQALLFFAIVSGQIVGFMGGSLVVECYQGIPRVEAIQNAFFWFGCVSLTASACCYFFVSNGNSTKKREPNSLKSPISSSEL